MGEGGEEGRRGAGDASLTKRTGAAIMNSVLCAGVCVCPVTNRAATQR